jgi:hypothetical protein
VFLGKPAPNTILREREVQPPGLDGGGEVDTTTMLNARWRTKQPKHLITLTDIRAQCQYDPIVYQTLVQGVLNVNQQIRIVFPDGHTVTFWGWLDKATPPSHKEGEFPLMEVMVHCSNQDNNGVEQAPVYA